MDLYGAPQQKIQNLKFSFNNNVMGGKTATSLPCSAIPWYRRGRDAERRTRGCTLMRNAKAPMTKKSPGCRKAHRGLSFACVRPAEQAQRRLRRGGAGGVGASLGPIGCGERDRRIGAAFSHHRMAQRIPLIIWARSWTGKWARSWTENFWAIGVISFPRVYPI